VVQNITGEIVPDSEQCYQPAKKEKGQKTSLFFDPLLLISREIMIYP